MDEPTKKRVDESWKEQVEREKHQAAPAGAPPAAGGPAIEPSKPQPPPAPAAGAETEELPQARFDLFVSGLVMEALIALGDMPHPTTRKQSAQLPQARYLIDLLGVFEEKTKGNLIAEEEQLLKDALYQLRMRYLSKTGGT
jgi:hypothetical protein